MADHTDVFVTKIVRRQFNKHMVDVTMADIRVAHGNVMIRGTVQAQKGAHYHDVEEECARVARIIRQRPEVRDVVLDCSYRNFNF